MSDTSVLARQVEGIADRLAVVPVQIEDANVLRRAADVLRTVERLVAGNRTGLVTAVELRAALSREQH